MEQVQLANGNLVVVKRTAVRDKKGFPISPRGPVRSLEVTFPDLRTVWKGDSSIRPLAIEIANGAALLAAEIHSREVCAKYGNPPGSVLLFRWTTDRWVRITRAEYPINARVNLLQEPWGLTSKDDVTGFVEHEGKQARPGNYMVRVPLDQRIADKAHDACELYKKL
jgi:hypothetical protein